MGDEMRTSRGVAGELLAALGDVRASSRAAGEELSRLTRDAKHAERDAKEAEREARDRERELSRLRRDIDRREREARQLDKRGEGDAAAEMRDLASADRQRIGRLQQTAEAARAEAEAVRERTDEVISRSAPRREELRRQREQAREMESMRATVTRDVGRDVTEQVQGLQMQVRGALAQTSRIATGQMTRADLESLGAVLQTGGAALARGGAARAGGVLSRVGSGVAGMSSAALGVAAGAGLVAYGGARVLESSYEAERARAETEGAFEERLLPQLQSGQLAPREVALLRKRVQEDAREAIEEARTSSTLGWWSQTFGLADQTTEEMVSSRQQALQAVEEIRALEGNRAAQRYRPEFLAARRATELERRMRRSRTGGSGLLGTMTQAWKDLYGAGGTTRELRERTLTEMAAEAAEARKRARERQRRSRTLSAGYQGSALRWGHMLRASERDRFMRAQVAARY